MSKCLNVNIPEIKALVDEFGEVVASKILDNFHDTIPTVDEAKSFVSKADNQLDQLVIAVKLFLNKKLAILRNKVVVNQEKKKNDIKRLLLNMKALDGVQSINIFIEDSYEKIKLAEIQFNNLIKNKDNYTRAELISRLTAFNDLANNYSILDEVSLFDIDEELKSIDKGIKEQGSFTAKEKLAYSIRRRDDLRKAYLKYGIPLLADHLMKFKSESLNEKAKKEIAEIQKRIEITRNSKLFSDEAKDKRIKKDEERIKELQGLNVDRATIIEQLKQASKDEGALDYMFSPLISSDDSVLALFAKSVKFQLEKARIKALNFAKSADSAFETFLKESGRNRDNVAEFNKGIYEELELNLGKSEDGNDIIVKKMAFVQKYNISQFQKNRAKFFKDLGEKPKLGPQATADEVKALKSWNSAVRKWMKLNTQPKPDDEIKAILNDKRNEAKTGIITAAEFQEWIDKNMHTSRDGEISYKGELINPSDDYINQNWSAMYSQDGVPISEVGKYHQFLLKSYLDAQEKLPENFRLGYVLPSIHKGNIERMQSDGVINTLKVGVQDATLKRSYDIEYGLAGLDDTDAKYIPVYYTQKMNSTDVSLDLISSVMRFSEMADRYSALNEISSEIAMTRQAIGERSTLATNSTGKNIIDAFAKKLGYQEYIKKNGESFSEKHLNAFIDMIVYGEMQVEETLFGLDAGKLTNTALAFSAITTIAMDLMKGVSNNLQGNIQGMIDANSGEYFTKEDVAIGKAFYFKNAGDFFSDFGLISPKTLVSQLVDLYDPMQGQFHDQYGKNISGSLAQKLFRTNTLFFNQNAGEHEIQVSMLFAMLSNKKVVDKIDGKEISLLDAYTKYGIDINDKVEFSENERIELQNSLHALNKRLNGVYNDFDKGTAQRYSLGRLAIMYRKHLLPGYKRRFKNLSGDQELGGITEGYYMTFLHTFVRDLVDYKLNIMESWSTYTDFEKKQIRRTISEASFIIALTAITIGLKKLGADDKKWRKNWLYNFMLYEATRLRSETAAYISPMDAYRVIKSPSAMTTTLERMIKFGDQFLLTWDPDKLKYKRKQSIWKKGDNKSWAYFLKLAGVSGYTMHPEEAVNAFNSTLVK